MPDNDEIQFKTKPLDFKRLEPEQMREASETFLETMRRRRSVRTFSGDSVPREVLLNCIEAAAQAPSGANKQPWTFVLVTDPELKHKIRESAEVEERAHYGGRAPEAWLADLAPLGTDANKPFLEIAPALIVVFAQKYGEQKDDQHYYVNESVGIATGFLLAALHHAGFVTLTHTPSPMKFLAEILERPENERAYILIPVGYPAEGCIVPDIDRKSLEEVLIEK
jgi:iodotyrosine deiodinase